MTHDKTSPRTNSQKAAHVIRVAERVLAEAYRHATRIEMIESQLRVRESVVREVGRRTK